MKKHLLIMTALACLCAGGLACAADMPSLFDQANLAFIQKNYRNAEADYQTIINQQGFSAPVLFNLGNAYYQDGRLGLAILNYERAQLLAPGDAAIAANLRLADAKAGLADRPMSWFEQGAHYFNLNTLSWLGGVAALMIAVGLAARQLTQRHRFGWRAWVMANICVLLVTAGAVGIQWPELNRAIVTVKNTPLYIAPVSIGQPMFTLGEGQTVVLRKAHGEFLLVETSDGHRGWVKREDVSRLIPAIHGERIT